MKKRGKQPKKKYVASSGIWLAFKGAQIIPNDELDSIRLKELSALSEFDSERATAEHLLILNTAINIAGEFANFGIGPEVLPFVEKAQEELPAAAERWRKTGLMTLLPETRHAMREVIDYKDLQMRSVGRSKVYEVARSVDNKIQSNMHLCIDLKKPTGF